MISYEEMRRRQLLPLKDKIDLSAERIEKLGYKEVMDYMNIPYKLPSDNWWSDD